MFPATPLECERRRQGYSQALLARIGEEQTGVFLTQYRISMIERGLMPTPEERRALAQVLRVSESYIFPIPQYGPPVGGAEFPRRARRGRKEIQNASEAEA